MTNTITLKCTCNQYQDIETPCCEEFKNALNNCNLHMAYSQKTRGYAFIVVGSGSFQLIQYCFCCGKKLPKYLRDEWEEILEKEYNIDNPTYADPSKIPSEFKTDEWWEKRGL